MIRFTSTLAMLGMTSIARARRRTGRVPFMGVQRGLRSIGVSTGELPT